MKRFEDKTKQASITPTYGHYGGIVMGLALVLLLLVGVPGTALAPMFK